MSAARWPLIRRMQAPTLLTIGRLVLAPIAVREILLRHPRAALGLLFAAGLTDLLDGWLARQTSGETEFGQLLDPLADKILLSGVYLGLFWIRTAPAWFVGLVFGRDLLLLIGSAAAMSKIGVKEVRTSLQPSLYGKMSTLFQISTAGIFLAGNALDNDGLRSAGMFLVWPTACLTASSGLHYIWRWLSRTDPNA